MNDVMIKDIILSLIKMGFISSLSIPDVKNASEY